MALQEEQEEQGNWLFKYRGVLPIIILVVGLALYLQTQLQADNCIYSSVKTKNLFQYVCLLVGIKGLIIRILTVGFTASNTSGRNTTEQVANVVNTTGIYSTVRHPLYLGNFFMWLGLAMLSANFWFVISFILLYWIYYERIMFAEEQFLRKKFGEQYLSWANKTPAFIPSFKHFVKSKFEFSWKKILRNEKNGFAALFMLFALFDWLGESVKGTTNYNYFILISGIVSGVLYLVLKFIKTKTTLLDLGHRG